MNVQRTYQINQFIVKKISTLLLFSRLHEQIDYVIQTRIATKG